MMLNVYIGVINRVLRCVCVDHAATTDGSVTGRLVPHFSRFLVLRPLVS